MADKQYNRKPVEADRGFDKDSDPLAELARVVGYGDYARHRQPDIGEADSDADLEDELLRTLAGPHADDHEAPDEEAGAPQSAHDAADDRDPMTLSLEEDLLRELERDDEPSADMPALQAAETDIDLSDAGDLPSGGQVDSAPSTDVEETNDDPAAENEEEGFFFPSANEADEDEEFASQSWHPHVVEADAGSSVSAQTGDAGIETSRDLSPEPEVQRIDPQPADDEIAPHPKVLFDTAPESWRDEPDLTGDADTTPEPAEPAPATGTSASQPAEMPDAVDDTIRPVDTAGETSWTAIAVSEPGEPESDALDDQSAFDESTEEVAEAASAMDTPTAGTSGTLDWTDDELPVPDVEDTAHSPDADETSVNATDEQEAAPDGGIGSDAVTASFVPVTVVSQAGTAAVPEAEDGDDAEADELMPDLDDILRVITTEDEPDTAGSAGEPDPADDSAASDAVREVPAVDHGEDDVSSFVPTGDADIAEETAATASLASAASALPVAAGYAAHTFDPAAIAEYDAKVEPIGDLDVPALPKDEPEAVVPAEEDEALDYDVDAALAQLVGGGDRAAHTNSVQEDDSGLTTVAAGSDAASAGIVDDAAAKPAHPAFADDFDADDLERALDADLGAAYPQSSQERQEEIGVMAATAGSAGASDRPAMWQNWKILGAGAAIILLVAGAVITFGFGNTGEAGADGPRIIAADAAPVKQKPKNPGGKVVPNQNKIVYDQVNGTKPETPKQKTLVTSNESPVDVVQRTLRPDLPRDPAMASGEPDGAAPSARGANATDDASRAGKTSAADTKSQDRLAPGKTAAAPTKALPSGVTPHYVETMTVNADGKLVPVNPQPSSSANASAADSATSGAGKQTQPASGAAIEQAAAADTQQGAGSQTVLQSPLHGPAPIPVQRPKFTSQNANDAPPSAASASSPEVASTPVSQRQTADSNLQPAAPSTGSQDSAAQTPAIRYFMQISSQPTQAGAKASYQNLNRRYPSLLGGRGVDIQQANIEGKGTYYRVRIPATSRSDAVNLCQSYKSAGGSCFVAR